MLFTLHTQTYLSSPQLLAQMLYTYSYQTWQLGTAPCKSQIPTLKDLDFPSRDYSGAFSQIFLGANG